MEKNKKKYVNDENIQESCETIFYSVKRKPQIVICTGTRLISLSLSLLAMENLLWRKRKNPFPSSTARPRQSLMTN
jgi:hypothetical protein